MQKFIYQITVQSPDGSIFNNRIDDDPKELIEHLTARIQNTPDYKILAMVRIPKPKK